ncbi:MAG: outer membrane lipoprotein chaperone LolA [Buchnera aphidicola (Chaetogeoica yunlongensis)]
MNIRKNFYIICFYILFLLVNTTTSFANDFTFKDRINKINSFCSNFKQIVIDASGVQIQKGIGKILVKTPGKFKWHLLFPHENEIISDGNIVWFYDPLIHHVSIFSIKDIMDHTPFIVFTHKHFSLLNDYKIIKNGDCFVLTPKVNINTIIKYCSICIDKYGVIRKIESMEKNMFKNIIYLYNYRKISLNNNNFKFKTFSDLSIDDQR